MRPLKNLQKFSQKSTYKAFEESPKIYNAIREPPKIILNVHVMRPLKNLQNFQNENPPKIL